MLLDLLKRGNSLAATTLLQDGNPVQLKVKQVLAVNVAHDLALLETGQRVDDYLRFIDEDALGPGEQLFVMGYLDGFTRQAVPDGMVYEDIFSFAVATDFPDLSGMSGSPILNASGRVVGVGYVAEHNVLYGVKTSYAKAFVAGESGTACSRHASLQSCLLAGARQVEDMAAGGDLRAIYELGEWPSNVHDIDSSMGNDLDSLMEAARQDYAPAEFDLGMTFDIHLNGIAFWRNVPAAVWHYKLEGYRVLKKWLSYRESATLKRPLRPEEVQYFADSARRIIGVLSMPRARTSI